MLSKIKNLMRKPGLQIVAGTLGVGYLAHHAEKEEQALEAKGLRPYKPFSMMRAEEQLAQHQRMEKMGLYPQIIYTGLGSPVCRYTSEKPAGWDSQPRIKSANPQQEVKPEMGTEYSPESSAPKL